VRTPLDAYRPQRPAATLLATGGAPGWDGASMLTGLLGQPDFARLIQVFSAATRDGRLPPTFMASLLGTPIQSGSDSGSGGGGNSSGFGSLDTRAMMSGSSQSQLLPVMADAMVGMSLGTPTSLGTTLFFDTAFRAQTTSTDSGEGKDDDDDADDAQPGRLYALSLDCPSYKAQMRTEVAYLVGQSQSQKIWSGEQLSPLVPLACVNVTVSTLASAAAIDEILFKGYRSERDENRNDVIQEYVAAYDFTGTHANALKVDVYWNDTAQARGRGGPPRLTRMNAPLNMAVSAYLQRRTGGTATAKLKSLRMMPQPARRLNLDFSSLLGPLFYVWLLQLLFPIGLAAVVYEKEQRLRMMIKMMGMADSVYWLVTYLWNLLVYCIFACVLYIGGSLIGLAFFTLNSASLQMVFYFIYGNLQIAFTILVSTIFTKSKTATVASYLWVFLSGLVANVLLTFFLQSSAIPTGLVYMLELIPAFSLYRGLYEFAQYAFDGAYKETDGMLWSNLSDEPNGLGTAMLIMVLEWPCFMLAALYLDQVLDAGTGVRQKWNFCLQRRNSQAKSGQLALTQVEKVVGGAQSATDGANSSRVGAAVPHSQRSVVIDAVGLTKVWPAADGNPPKTAVDNVDMTLSTQECFGLLGQNGAGKTTTIMMLCGFTEPTDGEALVAGLNIRHEMRQIYQRMGVCPQHNLLWESLTALEHVKFYASLKGVPKMDLTVQAMAALDAVSLGKVANKRAGAFSGGMKRRLSVAISLIGAPAVVFMDEPSTGLDPASRKQLWRAVHLAKQRDGCGIVLTTHSMQEAEELCDRLAIIRSGKVVVDGTPLALTKSYGDFLQVHLSLPREKLPAASALIKGLSPSMTLKEGLGGTQKYELSGKETNVQAVFGAIAAHKEELEIVDWGVQNASLEDVFVRMYGSDDSGTPSDGQSADVDAHHAHELRAFNTDIEKLQAPARAGFALSCAEECGEFWRHCCALTRKNVHIACRARGATFLQLTASFFFMFFVFIVDQAVIAQRASESRYQNLLDPPLIEVGSIPICEPVGGRQCYTFAYSPTGNNLVDHVVGGMRQNNVPSIAPSGVRGFATPALMDEYALTNPDTVQGAVHFTVEGSHRVSFELQFNGSVKYSRGVFQKKDRVFVLQLQHAVERELVRYHLSDPNLPVQANFREFAHPAFKGGSIVGGVGPPFFFAGAMFSFVIAVGSVVLERETKLRQAMEGMGLRRITFWCTWLLFELAMIFVSSLLLILFGVILQFDLFLKNSFWLSFWLFFLFQFAMLGLAFFLSTLTSKASAATSLGFIVFLFGFVIQLVVAFGFPYTSEFSRGFQLAFAAFPPALLAKGLGDLGDYTAREEQTGLNWSERNSYCKDELPDLCVMPLGEIYQILFWLFFIYFGAALWLDRVVPDDGAKTYPPWFCFLPSFWRRGSDTSSQAAAQLAQFESPKDEDVATEAASVQSRAGGSMGPAAAVELRGLTKAFGGGCWSSVRGSPVFHAVKAPWYEIRKNELFCLLGPNGAGKTTTINMLVGNMSPTSGDALQLGYSICSPAGMRAIQANIGVCPQFDVQWGQLTAWEHLSLFGTLKGLGRDPTRLNTEIAQRLGQVGLTKKEPWLMKQQQIAAAQAADMDMSALKIGTGQRVATFSGGEKRRLSVAMALMGEPKLLYLDEPTTGMDPISRREVWNLIHATKQMADRALILTTHSMEEAEILGDRVAIMAKGALRCIGSSLRLKQKFGAGFAVTVEVETAAAEQQVLEAFARLEVAPHDAGNGARRASASTRLPEPVRPGTSPLVPAAQEEQQHLHHSAAPGPRRADGMPSPEPPHAVNGMAAHHEIRVDAPLRTKIQSLRFTVPRGKEAELTEAMALLRATPGVNDVFLRLNTLEAVFLKIAKDAEIEEVRSKGQSHQLVSVEVEHESLKSGTAMVSLHLGSDQELLELTTVGGLKKWFVCSTEWGHDEDGSFMAIESSLVAATAEQLISNGVQVEAP
jgi:ABC-type multidrug transport system ATPase subunit